MKFVGMFLAGGCGVLARYWISGVVQRAMGSGFPWGTMIENISGCVIFGLVWTLAEERMLINAEMRTVILTGFVGAYTTFSTFAFETTALLRDAQWVSAIANLTAHNILGLVGIAAGMALGRLL